MPFLTDALPGTGGALRASDDDFAVDEVPAYGAAGHGEHVFVRIEKRGLTSPEAAERLARAVGCAPRDVGIAGMKDRRAVTRQWLSLPPPVTPETALAATLDGVTVLEAVRHPHKLRTGHLRANRFRLRVRGTVADAAARARAILGALAAPPGAPNWYGEQRFGRDGDNAARGRAILAGERIRDRRMARLMISALQAELFNSWLAARIADGLYARAIAGDVMHKASGGQFVCEDPAQDGARVAAGEIVPTGPMFGERMRRPPDGSAAAARELAILAAAGLAPGAFAAVRAIAEGTRRDAAIAIADVDVTAIAPDAIEVSFTLPSGAYATTVMREVMKESG
ncbi:MAG TPA: tRNA pseudouridine(13) synthase TruD [Kofleriaceae bacterium]|nr:tRNA pseudouridine(13) synthase TruD [Kofleriaceae bacterium]